MRNTLLLLLLLLLLSACQTHSLVEWKKPIKASIIEEVNVVPTIADTNQVVFSGLVTELETDDPVLFGSVAIFQGDRLIKGLETDFDGRFYFQLNKERTKATQPRSSSGAKPKLINKPTN